VSGFHLVVRELPLDKPLEDGESPIGIFEIHFCLNFLRLDFFFTNLCDKSFLTNFVFKIFDS
jgi:hypothetical protein